MGDSRTLAGRRLWIGIPGLEIDEATRGVLEEIRPGGIVLFRRNIASRAQVHELIAALRELLGADLLVSIDQEGGLVVRFHRDLTVFPGNMALGAIAAADRELGLRLAEEQGVRSAIELREVGCDINLAPDVDLASRGDNPGVGIRSFGADPELVGALAGAMVRGSLRGGVIPTLKHYPGLGEAAVDPHLDLPRIEGVDMGPHLRPYALAFPDEPVVAMTTHVVCPAFDPERPATLSPRIVGGMLRAALGPRGVIMTDDLEMGAMTRRFGFDEVIVGAAAAGHDVLCICHEPERQRRAFELLGDALATGAPWFGDAAAIGARLDGLRSPRPEVVPTARGPQLAEEIAAGAITVISDDRGLLPVPAGSRSVVAFPALQAGTMAEDPLRGEEDGSELFTALGEHFERYDLPLEPGTRDVDLLLEQAQGASRLLVVLSNARFLDAQAALARRAVAEHPGAILVSIRNPFDAEVIPAGRALTAITSLGFRASQLRALAAAIKGETAARGRLPITIKRVAP